MVGGQGSVDDVILCWTSRARRIEDVTESEQRNPQSTSATSEETLLVFIEPQFIN